MNRPDNDDNNTYIFEHYWLDRDSYWARQRLSKLIEGADLAAVQFMDKLAGKIPDNENTWDLAAGHFKTLADLVIKGRKAEEAAAILDSPSLFELLWYGGALSEKYVKKLQSIAEAGGQPVFGDNAIRDYYRYEASHWAQEKISNLTLFGDASFTILSMLESLVITAPDESSLGYFAAGPLEDLIKNTVENNNDPALAKAILESKVLRPHFDGVWPVGIIDKLEKLSNRDKSPRPPAVDMPARVTKKLASDFWTNEKTLWSQVWVNTITRMLTLSSVQGVELLAVHTPNKRLLIKMAQSELHTIVHGVATKPKKADVARAVMESPLLAPLMKYMGPPATVATFRRLASQ